MKVKYLRLACILTAVVVTAELWPGVATTVPSAMAAPRRGRKKPAPPKSKLPTDVKVARRPSLPPVDSGMRDAVAASAAKIDALVEANYKKFKVEPNPMTTDEEFVRRIYLDLNGTIPPLHLAESFLHSKSKTKRETLVDFLLRREDYVAHFYNFWADLLRLRDRIGRLDMEPYEDWIKQSLRENKPYDEMVREMLTAEGKLWDDPAAGYLLSDPGMPLDNMSNTVRIFLGTRIGCAQCHDHPFDRWTQKEFYEIAAFTGQTSTRAVGAQMKGYGPLQKTLRESRSKNGRYVEMEGHKATFNVIQTILQSNRQEISEQPKRQLRFPSTYAYGDAKPNSVVQPKTLFGKIVTAKKGENRREVFAKWLTTPDNPRFARAMANRLWKQMLGVGLIEPVDDIQDDTVAENEPLLAFLEKELIRLKFDTRELLRIIAYTKTYQRQSSMQERDPSQPYHFPGPILRRMSAEQVWDSFLTLAIEKPDAYAREYNHAYVSTIDVDFSKAQPKDLVEKAAKLDTEFIGGKARSAREKAYKYKGVLLARAYELPSPLPPGHFLREFGQSDRELIGAASTDGSIPQILTMLNGPITHMLLEAGSVMYDNVIRARTLDERVDVIFLSVLCREPTRAERRAAEAEIRAAGARGYGNVIWALVNTREFLFVQ